MRFFIGLFITIGLIILILVLLFRGGGDNPKQAIKPLRLPDYSYTDAVAQMIVDGPIVSEQKHREIRIQVSQQEVTMNVYQGYQQTLVKTQTYPNNVKAWTAFLFALQRAGYTLGDANKALRDERGTCSAGTRSIYSFSNDGKDLMRFWRTSCGTGTFKGTTNSVRYLFTRQVPDYQKLAQGTSL